MSVKYFVTYIIINCFTQILDLKAITIPMNNTIMQVNSILKPKIYGMSQNEILCNVACA